MRAMFELPRYVLKDGEIVVEKGDVRGAAFGRTLFVEPEFDASILPAVKKWFSSSYSMQFENYAVNRDYLPETSTSTACGEA